ncbi:MAG: hypothetical protein K2L15_02475 [Eubacteriales bacterium]|nr:hypothetical protein [Eubacteriales bacterium]
MKEIKIKLIKEFTVTVDAVFEMYRDGIDVSSLADIESWIIDYYEFWDYEYDDVEIDYKEIQKFAIECYKEFSKGN